ncbi:MAG: F0F1 ATP synthase subunit A [Armatimonadota bacterium]
MEPNQGGSGLVEGSPWALVLMSWIAILVLGILAYLGTRRMRRVPGPLQNVLEFTVDGLFNFIGGIIGPGGRKYAPFIATFFVYILFMNLMGLVPGFRSPTSGLNMTVALGLLSFFYVQYQAIRQNGFIKYIVHFWGEPWWLGPLMFPIHIIGELAKPLSLSIRLFGNIFGEDKIIIILAGLSPFLFGKPWLKYIPVQFPMEVFAVFTSFIQALIFTVLTAAYLTVLMTHEEEPANVGSH